MNIEHIKLVAFAEVRRLFNDAEWAGFELHGLIAMAGPVSVLAGLRALMSAGPFRDRQIAAAALLGHIDALVCLPCDADSLTVSMKEVVAAMAASTLAGALPEADRAECLKEAAR